MKFYIYISKRLRSNSHNTKFLKGDITHKLNGKDFISFNMKFWKWGEKNSLIKQWWAELSFSETYCQIVLKSPVKDHAYISE